MAPLFATQMLVAAFAGSVPANTGHAVTGCDDNFLSRLEADMDSRGPMRLAAVTCGPFESGAMSVAPDAAAAVQWPYEPPGPVRIVGLLRPSLVDVPNRVTFQAFGANDRHGSAPEALAWSSDSRSLWSVRQQTISPGGFAFSGLRPVRIGLDGKVTVLPALRHPAGPLDALQWVGGKGLAIAQFGSKGGYYRPEHRDLAPTLAIVDAARGRVLVSFAAAEVEALRKRVQEHGLMVGDATATVLPNGRLKAVLHFWPWQESRGDSGKETSVRHPALMLSWTQGEAPATWPSPYGGFFRETPVLTPDGSRLLTSRPLYEKGLVITGCRIRCRQPGPPPKPVSGTIAELYDLATRRALWTISGHASGNWAARSAPVISGDGRYALIEMPPDGDRLPVALISMRNGRILQRLLVSHVGSYQQSFGFARGGRQVWHGLAGVVRTYDLHPR